MSWRDYDQEGVPLWNEVQPPEVQEKMEKELRLRVAMTKHEMPVRKAPKVKPPRDNTMCARICGWLTGSEKPC